MIKIYWNDVLSKSIVDFFSGDYVCQISDKQNKDQVHTVEILGKLPFQF